MRLPPILFLAAAVLGFSGAVAIAGGSVWLGVGLAWGGAAALFVGWWIAAPRGDERDPQP